MLSSVKNATHSLGKLLRGRDDFSGPRHSDKTRDYAILGGAVGVVAGATIGTIKGFDAQSANSLEENWVEKKITSSELKGYNHSTQVDRDTYCVDRDQGACVKRETKTEGWWHHYSPNVKDRIVGSHQAPEFHNTRALEPLSGALIGGVVGGLVGAVTGLGLATLTKSLANDEAQAEVKPLLSGLDSAIAKRQSKTTQDTGNDAFDSWNSPSKDLAHSRLTSSLDTRLGVYAIAGTTLGAGVGAYLGVQAGATEQAANLTNTRTWSVPVYENKTIGHIPDGYYEHKRTFQWSPSGGGGRPDIVPVGGKVPVRNADGSIKMEPTQQTFHSQRYNKVVGGLAGGAIGAGIGLAAGVGLGIADKLLVEAITKS